MSETADEEIEINVKLWWGVEIRKVTIRKGDTAIALRTAEEHGLCVIER
ncbi:MAG TPA: hypothetical protein VMW67_05590 [Desulfobacteria bacterium]|nr:hypothetical protein [Desulfobacteria bacterium]